MWRFQWGQKPWVYHFPYCLFPEFFCFAFVLKFRGSHILRLDSRNVRSHCALLWLVKPVLLHLGLFWEFLAHYYSGPQGESVLVKGLHLQWRGLYYLICPLFPVLALNILSCRWVKPGDQTLEAYIGDLVPVNLLSRPPLVGACFRIC